MPHSTPLITTIAAAFGLALLLGFAATRLRVPALVGYLLAGILIGPFTPGFVADGAMAAELAEIGVMLLMFGVGLHFSLDDLLKVRNIALPGAVLQIVAATGLGGALAMAWGWSWGAALVFGLALSVASTVVLLRALEANGSLDSMNGRIAVGWLVVEDLAMVLVLVLLPPLAGTLGGAGSEGEAGNLGTLLGITLLKVAAFIAVMLIVGRRVFPYLLRQIARTGSRELFTLCVIAAAISIAYVSTSVFGVSFALGAFFAGMVLRESEFSHRAAEDSLPLREAFAVLFFVSVGMLFDPAVLLERPWQVLAVVAIIIVGKSLAAIALVVAFRYPLNTALHVSASLAQIGEFSFILAGLGVSLGLLPPEGQGLILAGALISIALNPLVFACAKRVGVRVEPPALSVTLSPSPADDLTQLPTSTPDRFLSGQVVMAGGGHTSTLVRQGLHQGAVPLVVLAADRTLVEELRALGIAAVWGEATDPAALIQAHIARASMLIVTDYDQEATQHIVHIARSLNPGIETVLQAPDVRSAAPLAQEAGDKVFYAEHELAKGVTQYVLERYGKLA